MNHFNRLWGVGIAPSCLVPGPEVILGQVDSGSTCESLIKEVVGEYTLWIGRFAHERHISGESLANSRHWLILGGTVFAVSARAQISKRHKF